MKKTVKTIEYNMAEIVSAYAFAPIGGGGNPLRAWVLACFDVAYSCIDWFLGCFNNKLCNKMHATNIVLNLLPCKVKGGVVNLKKAITPHLILQENKFSAKSSSPSRGEECWELVIPMNNLCRCWFRNCKYERN